MASVFMVKSYMLYGLTECDPYIDYMCSTIERAIESAAFVANGHSPPLPRTSERTWRDGRANVVIEEFELDDPLED